MAEAISQERQLRCSICQVQTRHQVLAEHDTGWTLGEDTDIHWRTTAMFLHCKGCGEPTLEICRYSSEDEIDGEGNSIPRVKLYPQRRDDLDEITGLDIIRLPHQVRAFYGETLNAIHNDLPLLATAGIRATLEALCDNKQANGGDLKERISDLVKKGLIASQQEEYLQTQRMIGNDAVHSFVSQPMPVIKVSLKILQNLLRAVYHLPAYAASIERSRKPGTHKRP